MNPNYVLNYNAGDKKITRIALALIVVSHNPRRPARVLQDNLVAEGLFHEKGEEKVPYTPLELVHELALSEDAEKRAKFVALIEKYESGSRQVVELAASRLKDEIQPITLRSFRTKNKDTGDEERYGVVAGERRLLAAAYNYAKHGKTPDIAAQCRKLTVTEAFDLAVLENAQRSDPTPIEEGLIYRGYREQVNPATGQNYTLKDIAIKLNLDYQEVRGREALTYLSESEKRRVEEGKIGLTVAINKGLLIKQHRTVDEELPNKKEVRQRALNLTQIQVLFDASRDKSQKYLQALADVMRVDLEVANKESDRRIAEAEAAEIAEATRADKKSLKTRKAVSEAA